MVSQVLLLVTIGAVLPPLSAPKVSRDQPSSSAEQPPAATWSAANLSADVRVFYERIATNLNSPLDAVLRPLSDSYFRRSYELGEFESALRSLRHLIESGNDAALETAVRDETARQTTDDREVIILYLDPTCEVCQGTLELVSEARLLSGTSFPAVVMRVMPSSEDASIQAAVVLRRIEKLSPSSFEDAFREFLTLLPENPSRLPDLSVAYLGNKPVDSMPEYESLRKKLLSERKRFNAAGYFPPVVSYRGRTLRKDQGPGVPFDPLHDSQSLLQTILLIRAFDAHAQPSKH
jgi:hypothetical protein